MEFLGELVEKRAEGITTEEVVGVGEAEVVSEDSESGAADSESGVELETVSRVELETRESVSRVELETGESVSRVELETGESVSGAELERGESVTDVMGEECVGRAGLEVTETVELV